MKRRRDSEETNIDVADLEKKGSGDSAEKRSSQSLACRRETFSTKNEQKVGTKQVASSEVSSILTNSLIPKDCSFYFFPTLGLVRLTY